MAGLKYSTKIKPRLIDCLYIIMVKNSKIVSYSNVRDPLVGDASFNSTTQIDIVTDSTGAAKIGTVYLSPFGVQVPVLTSTSSGSAVSIGFPFADGPHLPWLYNMARNFQFYRITRATLIFVSNVSTNATGKVLLSSANDAADQTAIAFSRSTGEKSFSLAVAGSREQRHNCFIDSTWKPCTSKIANSIASVGGSLVPTNTVQGITFSSIFCIATGAPVSTTIGSLFCEYDVQFKDPIAYTQNV